MPDFINRATTLIEPTSWASLTLLKVDQVVLHYGPGRLDIGCLCYKLRKIQTKLTRWQPHSTVVLSSFNPERVARVKKLTEAMCLEYETLGLRPKSLLKRHSLIRHFIDWADDKGFPDALESITNCESAYRAYCQAVNDDIRRNIINVNTGAVRANQFDFWENYWGSNEFGRGIARIRRDAKAVTSTSVPSEEYLEKHLGWYACLFEGLSELVLGNHKYPYKLNVPTYIGAQDGYVWVFPNTTWAYSPITADKAPVTAPYDIATGRILTPAEWLDRQVKHGNVSADPGRGRRVIREYTAVQDAANSDMRHFHRLRAGSTASMAFLALFIANTGINPTQVLNLPWSDDLFEAARRPEITRQGFRTVKYRAGGRVVSFEIGIAFMPKFKRFLELRKYLLNGANCPTLFFSTILYTEGAQFVPAAEAAVTSIYKTVSKMFDPALKKVTPKEWRAAVQDWAIRNADPVTAAMLLQHSPSTALAYYSNGSETTHQVELGDFLRHVEGLVLKENEVVEGAVEKAIGLCANPSHPHSISTSLPIKPDCKNIEGCLFCDQFRVHADATDIRKLISCRQCVNKVAPLADSHEHFISIFGPVLGRIEFILGEIRACDEQLLKSIEHEVDVLGELTPYWSTKLEMLMELGLL